MGGGFGDLGGEELDGLGADVKGHHVRWEWTRTGKALCARVGREPVGEDVIDGQEEFHLPCGGLGERGLRYVDLVGLDERLAGGLALGVEEGVGHGAADEQRVHLAEQGVDDLNLVRGPWRRPMIATKGRLGSVTALPR